MNVLRFAHVYVQDMNECLKIRPHLYEWMSQDSPTPLCSICMNVSRFVQIYVQDMNECLKIRSHLCAAYVWMSQDSPISMCRIWMNVSRFDHSYMNERLKIRPHLCAAYVWMSQDSPISMCRIWMNEWLNALRFAQIYVQDMHECRRFAHIHVHYTYDCLKNRPHLTCAEYTHEYQRHDATTTNLLCTQHSRQLPTLLLAINNRRYQNTNTVRHRHQVFRDDASSRLTNTHRLLDQTQCRHYHGHAGRY